MMLNWQDVGECRHGIRLYPVYESSNGGEQIRASGKDQGFEIGTFQIKHKRSNA